MPQPTKTNWETKAISIKDLSLWDENSRFPDYLQGSDEKELIQALFKKYDIENLAYEIVKDFDLPQLERIVVFQKGKRLIVLEGNRRISTYKCLINPTLIENETLSEKFKVLKAKIGITDNFKIEALVTQTKDEGMRFTDRKHYRRNNEIGWGEYERHNHIKRTRKPSGSVLSGQEAKSIFRANIGDIVRKTTLPEALKREILGKGFVTTFYRVVDSDAGRKKLKYERTEENNLRFDNEKDSLSLLEVIIFNVLNKETLDGKPVNSRTLNNDVGIKEYLSLISSQDAKRVSKVIAANQKTGKAASHKEKGKSKAQPSPKPQTQSPFTVPNPQKPHNFSTIEAGNIILLIGERFPVVAAQLLKRYGNRKTFVIKDEYDVQDLFHSILKIFFDDVRTEEWGPSHAGAASRIDMLLRDDEIGIEIKKTRQGLTSRKVGDDLILDIARYRKYRNCKRLFFFIYDPERRINNPKGLESDIKSHSTSDFLIEITVKH